MILGIDTGGTFTDFVLLANGKITTHKELSTPAAPEQAILQGITALGLTPQSHPTLKIIHGTTVATNAALEHKGVKTAYISNAGFADTLTIGRQARAELYNLQPQPVPPPVPRELCFEVNCRRDYQGNVITPLRRDDIARVAAQVKASGVKAVAINLLYAYLDGSDEQAIADALPNNLFVSCSHHILPMAKEYERGITTWLNSWLGPKVNTYLQTLAAAVAPWPVAMMQSSGGTISAVAASRRPVDLLLSGPAGGLAAAKAISELCNSPRLLTFDMGGTSTDVALIDGDIGLSSSGTIGRYPAAVPMVDMLTIGAGGGSLAEIDAGDMLQVGPQSAGADPGPACYGNGGQQVTVSDANVVLGRIPEDTRLAGALPLDINAAVRNIARLAERLGSDSNTTATGIIAIANENMAQALRRISIERGVDPQQFTLCCFGGAGGLHVCALAAALNIQRAIVPNYSGVLSALGLVLAPARRQAVHSLLQTLDTVDENRLAQQHQQLGQQLSRELAADGNTGDITVSSQLAIRFQGQSHSLTAAYTGSLAASVQLFRQHYRQRYGSLPARPVELESLQVAATVQCGVRLQHQPATTAAAPVAGRIQRGQLPHGKYFAGPLIVYDDYATCYVAAGWQVSCDSYLNLLLERQQV